MAGRASLVVVTDADQRGAVAALRALSLAGYRTLGTSAVSPASGHWSRACDLRGRTPPPGEGAAFADAIRQAVADSGTPTAETVLMATTDMALECLSLHRDRLGDIVTGFPDHAVVEACLDKPTLLAHAAQAGLPGPASRDCTTAAEVDAALDELGSAVIVKPWRSEPIGGGRRRTAEAPSSTAAARKAALAHLPVTIQSRLDDARLLMVGGVALEGALRCAVTFEAQRLWPGPVGSASAAVTVPAPPGLLARVAELISAMGWRGPFNLDLLAEPDGRLLTIDLNPRLFAPLDIAIRSGADIPVTWCRLLAGDDPPYAEGRPGVVYRWDEAELAHAAAALRRGRFRESVRILWPSRRSQAALWRVSDPGPLGARLIEVVRRRGVRWAQAGDLL